MSPTLEPAQVASPPESAPTRGRGRPRSAAAHQAILDAAIDILAESGIEALTVEGIASRAGVGKTTIYRRWPNKELLLVEAVSNIVTADEPLPDNGSIREDLIAIAQVIRGSATRGRSDASCPHCSAHSYGGRSSRRSCAST